MRIREIAYYASQVDFEKCSLGYKDSNILNINAFKDAISILKNIPILQQDIDNILDSVLYRTSQDILFISSGNYRVYQIGMDIIGKAKLLLQIANQLYPPLQENTISIKIADTADLKVINQTIKTIEQVLYILVADEAINSSVTVENWEHGSFWLNLYTGSFLAVGIISSAAWSAAVVAKKMQEDKILEQKVRSLELGNKYLEDLVEKQKQLLDELIDLETSAIVDKHLDATQDAERISRIRQSIRMLAELIQQGTEINPALTAPEDVKNLFPDYSRLEHITSKVKQIEHKK